MGSFGHPDAPLFHDTIAESNATVFALYSIVCGNGNHVYGAHNIVYGDHNVLFGEHNIAHGSGNTCGSGAATTQLLGVAPEVRKQYSPFADALAAANYYYDRPDTRFRVPCEWIDRLYVDSSHRMECDSCTNAAAVRLDPCGHVPNCVECTRCAIALLRRGDPYLCTHCGAVATAMQFVRM